MGRYLFDRGIYVTMAAYPLVPKHEVGFRVQITAANSDEEVELLVRGPGRAGRAIQPPARGASGLQLQATRPRRTTRAA